VANYLHFSVDFDWVPGSEKSVPKLFDLFQKYQLRPTLFFTGGFASAYPEIVQQAMHLSYEIGTHGHNHGLDSKENFGPETPYQVQKELICRSTEAVSRITSVQPVMFRAPLLNISQITFEILCEQGYTIDSSVPARRFDFGAGCVGNLASFFRPSVPFSINTKHGTILEIPPSACILPLNMRLLRTFPFHFVRCFSAILEKTNRPLVFYMHPTEFVYADDLTYPKGDYRGFYHNCGPHNFAVLESFLALMQARGIRSEYMAKSLSESCGG
jgi:hypothetical protein